MPTFTSRQLADAFQVKVSRLKRWAREFLGIDPLAGMRTGYTREFTANDAFLLFLGGQMVTHLDIPVNQVAGILEALKSWLHEKGLLPEPHDYSSDPSDQVEWIDWRIEITRAKPQYYCTAVGTIKKDLERGSSSELIVKEISTRRTLGKPSKVHGQTFYYWSATTLAISALLSVFMLHIDLFPENFWQAWCKKTGRHIEDGWRAESRWSLDHMESSY